MGTININGQTIEVPPGSSVSVDGEGNVIIDGQPYGGKSNDIKIEVIGNGLINLKVQRGSVKVTGDVGGDVDAGGSVTCGNVGGKVDAGGSANCGDVKGNVDAGGSVNCGSIGGSVDAGGSVRHK
jgi:hypothetical protein